MAEGTTCLTKVSLSESGVHSGQSFPFPAANADNVGVDLGLGSSHFTGSMRCEVTFPGLVSLLFMELGCFAVGVFASVTSSLVSLEPVVVATVPVCGSEVGSGFPVQGSFFSVFSVENSVGSSSGPGVGSGSLEVVTACFQSFLILFRSLVLFGNLFFGLIRKSLGRSAIMFGVGRVLLGLFAVESGPAFGSAGFGLVNSGFPLSTSCFGSVSFPSGAQKTDLVKLATNMFGSAFAGSSAGGAKAIFDDTANWVSEVSVVACDDTSDSLSCPSASSTVRNHTVALAPVSTSGFMFTSAILIASPCGTPVTTFFGSQGKGLFVIFLGTSLGHVPDMGIRQSPAFFATVASTFDSFQTVGCNVNIEVAISPMASATFSPLDGDTWESYC